MQFDGPLEDIDGAIHACTEAARLRQQNFGVGGGDSLAHQSTPGNSGVLKEINDDSALFDFNHPLAGIRLKVDVALL
ncbi:hypothetical protein LLE87_35270, partial [Paenibacillus polymyxa]|nr:hypothetical protein [Paenibacillus polymyxa]